MNNIDIYFDGILQNINDFDGTESISFVYRNKTQNGESAFGFSPELTVRGSAYDYLVQQIINKPNPKLENIKVLVYDNCCLDLSGNPRQVFDGLIEGADVRWCLIPFCEATVTVIDDTPDAQAIKCLKNTNIWERKIVNNTIISNGINEFRVAPLITYCDDIKPSSSHEFLLVLGIIFFIIFTPIIALFNLFNLIAGDTTNYFNALGTLITSCQKVHTTPYIHSYLSNLCKFCNLGLQSSLFEPGGYYHNTVRLDAAYIGKPYFETNKPNLNGVQFLDEFKEFNIDWRVTNGVLQIERKDFFQGPLWFDTTLLPVDNVLSLCVEATDLKPAAYAEYMYAKDGGDLSGDEVAPKWVDRSIDWNIPINPVQTGLFSKKLMYSASQFRFDINRDEEAPIDKPGYVFFYPVLSLPSFETSMLMSNGTTSFPKLIDIDFEIIFTSQTSSASNFQKQAIPRSYSVSGSNLFAYNVRWWIKETPFIDAAGVSHDTAYQRLFCIDDPRNNSIKIRRFTLTVTADCNLIRTLSVDKIVRMSIGDGQVDEITYDTTNNSLTITGKV
jgi:hypothetical protein